MYCAYFAFSWIVVPRLEAVVFVEAPAEEDVSKRPPLTSFEGDRHSTDFQVCDLFLCFRSNTPLMARVTTRHRLLLSCLNHGVITKPNCQTMKSCFPLLPPPVRLISVPQGP